MRHEYNEFIDHDFKEFKTNRIWELVKSVEIEMNIKVNFTLMLTVKKNNN